jgi:hypothetical protein
LANVGGILGQLGRGAQGTNFLGNNLGNDICQRFIFHYGREVHEAMLTSYSTLMAQMTYLKGAMATMDDTAPVGRAIGATRMSPQASTRTEKTDSMATFREQMRIQYLNWALTMEELLNHEGQVLWVVLRQHNHSKSQSMCTLGIPETT